MIHLGLMLIFVGVVIWEPVPVPPARVEHSHTSCNSDDARQSASLRSPAFLFS